MRIEPKPENLTLVGFHQDLATIFVVVRRHLPGLGPTDEDAKDRARYYLTELGWFGDKSMEAELLS